MPKDTKSAKATKDMIEKSLITISEMASKYLLTVSAKDYVEAMGRLGLNGLNLFNLFGVESYERCETVKLNGAEAYRYSSLVAEGRLILNANSLGATVVTDYKISFVPIAAGYASVHLVGTALKKSTEYEDLHDEELDDKKKVQEEMKKLETSVDFLENFVLKNQKDLPSKLFFMD